MQIRFILNACFLAVASYSSGEQISQSKYEDNLVKNLGSIDLEGLPRVELVLDDLWSRIFGYAFSIRHVVKEDSRGRGYSSWEFTGLQTYLVYSGRDSLEWKPLWGEEMIFEKIGSGKVFRADHGVEVRFQGGNNYRIREPNGFASIYQDGELIRYEHPFWGNLECDMDGPWLLRAQWEDGKELIRVLYSGTGRPTKMEFSKKVYRFQWAGEVQLSSFENDDGKVTDFEYENQMLRSIKDPSNGVDRKFEWGANRNFGKGNSRWVHPVYLKHDGDSSYDYSISRKGYRISRRVSGTRLEILTYFNPDLNRVEQRMHDESILYELENSMDGNRRLVTVMDSSGNVLADYGRNLFDESAQGVNERGSVEKAVPSVFKDKYLWYILGGFLNVSLFGLVLWRYR